MSIVHTNDFQEGYQLGVQDCFYNSLSYTAGEYDDGFKAGYMKAMKEAEDKKFSEDLEILKRVKDLMIDERVDWQLQMKSNPSFRIIYKRLKHLNSFFKQTIGDMQMKAMLVLECDLEENEKVSDCGSECCEKCTKQDNKSSFESYNAGYDLGYEHGFNEAKIQAEEHFSDELFLLLDVINKLKQNNKFDKEEALDYIYEEIKRIVS